MKIFLLLTVYFIFQIKGNNFEINTKDDCEMDEKVNCTFGNCCLKITIYKNGIVEKECIEDTIDKNYKERTSIQFNESFIIFDCLEEDKKESCPYYGSIKGEAFNSGCSKYQLDGDNICCNLRMKYNNARIGGCVEVNKFEIEKFKWILSDELFEKSNDTEDIIGQLECTSKLYKINLFLILIIYINLCF